MTEKSKDPWHEQKSGERQAWLITGALMLICAPVGGIVVKTAIDRFIDRLSEAIVPAGEAIGKVMGKAIIDTGLEIGRCVEDFEQEKAGLIPPGTAIEKFERRNAGNK